MSADTSDHDKLIVLTAKIVENYLRGNSIAPAEIPSIIQTVYRGLTELGQSPAVEPEKPQPAISIRKSITPEYIICLEDGKKLKMLKRHLRSTYGMTPEQYRAKWGLPRDYPMVAPNYAAQRSEFAKQLGLGRKTRKTTKRPRRTARTA
jgi:predicted transcriptional regulator